MTNIIPSERAKSLLEDITPLVLEAHYDALEATQVQARGAIGIPSKGATAYNFNSNVINAFKSKIAGRDDIQVLPKTNTFVFVIKDTLATKFKKHNKKGLSSNISTKQVGYLLGQQLHLAFPGMSLISYLEFAHRTNDSYTEFEFIKVVCTYNKQVIWAVDLLDTDQGESSEQIPLAPIAPQPIIAPSKRFTINDKKDKAINE